MITTTENTAGDTTSDIQDPAPSTAENFQPSCAHASIPAGVQTQNSEVQGSKVPDLETCNLQPATCNPQIQPPFTSAAALLNSLEQLLPRFVVLPKHAAETLALWIVHTYCFQFRDVSTYIGLESPEKRCGKTTLLGVLSKLVNRPVIASNISPSAFFRVIEEMRPTLLIDEADTFLQGNDEIRGILNAGYHSDTAYVIRVSNVSRVSGSNGQVDRAEGSGGANGKVFSLQSSVLSVPNGGPSTINPSASDSASSNSFNPINSVNSDASRSSLVTCPSTLATYSTWCPKIIAAIGHLPETLADRSIVIRMQRKHQSEQCERMRNFAFAALREQCAQFAITHRDAIAGAKPQIPETLHDRAADIWEPLFAIADIAGGDWPERARSAATALTARAGESNPAATLLLDIGIIFVLNQGDRLFTSQIIQGLNSRRFATRPWMEARRGKPVTEIWLSQKLRPYGVKSRVLRIGDRVGKGYDLAELQEIFARYVPQFELDNSKAEFVAQLKLQPGNNSAYGTVSP